MRPRPIRRAAWRIAALCSLLCLLPAPALATTAATPLQALRDAAANLPEAQSQAVNETLDAAAAADREAEALAQRLSALHAELVEAPARTAAFERQLAQDRRRAVAAWQAQLPSGAGVEALEIVLERERLALDQLRQRIASLTSELATSLAQPGGGAVERAEMERRVEELAAPLVAAEGEPAALTEARRARNAAERRRLQAELALRQAQQDATGTRQRLVELELRALRHQQAMQAPRLAILRERIATRGREELEALAAEQAVAAERLAAAPPALAGLAGDNARLAGELVDQNEALERDRAALAEADAALARDQAGLRDSRTRLEVGGQSAQVGTWLWSELRRLEPEGRLRAQLDQVREALSALRLRLVALDERQRTLDDLPAAVRTVADALAGEDDGAVAGEDAIEGLLERQRDLADRLEPLAWRRVATLEQTERSVQARLEANEALRQLLARQLLWIRSHPPVDAAWAASFGEGVWDLVKPSRFATTVRLLAESLAARPGGVLASLALVALLGWLRRRARPGIERLAEVVRDVRQDRYRRSLECLGWTVAAALPVPMLLWLAGRWLQLVGEAGRFSDSLGGALEATALPAFTLAFLRWLVRERGLAHAHFRWSRPRREALRRWLPTLAWTLPPLFFIVALAFVRNQELAISVSGRIAMTLAAAVSGWALWSLLAPDQAWHSRGPGREPSLARRALRIGLPLLQLACIALAVEGYLYTSALILDAQFASVGIVTAVAVVHGLLSRWFVLGERRLALKRQIQREAGAAEPGAEAAADPDGGEAVPVNPDEEITLEKVNEHSRRLLRALKLSLLVVGLVVVWSGVLPAIARFDDIALWRITEAAADGGSQQVPITLMAVMAGLLVLALTFVAARNLPGLIEIGLLSRVNMDAASRYAVTSVSRYAIVLVGVLVGLGLLGARWGQLQWLAAALTVGLGFGLQEIFANFVSGLILLFERPFRVGDVITVNGLDGTVTRIRTRATTILDFENKEIVVPNKAFITGQLVNWTLSDETTRVTVKVGVDYGTDPALVHRLLMQAAEENARVLANPPPRSWLLDFGANSLDFELRVFVGAMGDRLAVRNEINMRLVELFGAHGIGFAFPQLDVHVRDLPPSAPPADAAAPGPRG